MGTGVTFRLESLSQELLLWICLDFDCLDSLINLKIV